MKDEEHLKALGRTNSESDHNKSTSKRPAPVSVLHPVDLGTIIPLLRVFSVKVSRQYNYSTLCCPREEKITVVPASKQMRHPLLAVNYHNPLAQQEIHEYAEGNCLSLLV